MPHINKTTITYKNKRTQQDGISVSSEHEVDVSDKTIYSTEELTAALIGGGDESLSGTLLGKLIQEKANFVKVGHLVTCRNKFMWRQADREYVIELDEARAPNNHVLYELEVETTQDKVEQLWTDLKTHILNNVHWKSSTANKFAFLKANL